MFNFLLNKNKKKNKLINSNNHFCAAIGQFTQVSDSILVSDPSYDYKPEEHDANSNSWKLNLVLNPALKGKWNIALLIKAKERDRNAVLLCVHESENFQHATTNNYSWTKHENIGVDAGMAGIYDLQHYRNDNVVSEYPNAKKESNASLLSLGINADSDDDNESNDIIIAHNENMDPGEKWYDMNCKITMKATDYAGCVPYGAVSSSGYGDGIYDVYISKNNDGQVCAIKIVFIE